MHEEMVKLEQYSNINEDKAGKYWQVKVSFEAIKKWLNKYNAEVNDYPNPECVSSDKVPIAK